MLSPIDICDTIRRVDVKMKMQSPLCILVLIMTQKKWFLRGENDAELNFDCTNDFTEMFCQFEQQHSNCTDHNVTLVLIDYSETTDGCTQCDKNQCCCSLNMLFVFGESHNASVWRGDKRVASKTISVKDTFKPKTPTIVNVTETNGNFAVKWKTNMEGVRDELTAVVTYHKKGDPEEVIVSQKPPMVDGYQYYEISGGNLSSGATYVVSVRSVSEWNKRQSDSSAEWEFKTRENIWIMIMPISGKILKTTSFYVIVSAEWQKLIRKSPLITSVLSFLRSERQFTGSEESDGSSQDSSGISDCSSHLSYAETVQPDCRTLRQEALEKFFPNVGPVSPVTNRDLSEVFNDHLCGVTGTHDSSGSSGVINPTYCPGMSGSPDQFMPDPPRVLESEPSYHTPKCDTVTNSSLSGLCPASLDVLSPISTDMSYQGTTGSLKMSVIEDYSPLSLSSGTCTTLSPEARNDADSDNPKLPCGSAMLPRKEETQCNFLKVENDYQPVQRRAEEISLLSPENLKECKDNLEKCPEKSMSSNPRVIFCRFDSILPDLISESVPRQPEHQKPLFLSAPWTGDVSIPIVTESGYKQV
uniref:Fibronectin type-III domain-containing protein n=1 Tax=Oryzias latipes TaxID=8090 RepID=A0A3P9IPC9_ORYLA